MEFFDKLSETIVSAGKDVGQKAKDVSGIAKLKMDIRSKEVFKLQGAVECPKCGAKMPQGAAFCSSCGTKMDDIFEE